MIRLKDVEMEYDNGPRAIKGISLTIEDGEFVFLVGPSGSGKTTIMKLITGEIRPTSGEILVDGFSITKEPEKAKRCIGYLPELPPLYMDMTVEKIRYCLRRRFKK